MSRPGYGKRTASDQLRRTAHDFAHLAPREAAIASYIDRLPEGADISVKTLAKNLPYGQCALRTALNRLQTAGHLRRGRECVTGESGSSHWITRTWFSRTPRDDTWWARFTRGDVHESNEDGDPDPARATRTPERTGTAPAAAPTRSRALVLLAALGRTTPALSLSQAECVTLAPLLQPWLERGATDEYVHLALTSGLPTPIHSPAALLRTRLRDKLPPEPPPSAPEPSRRGPLRMLECATCRAPGRPEALPGGTCGPCRGEPTPPRPKAPVPAPSIHARAAEIRAAMSQRR
ncbi:hypothetical protein ACWD4G_36450 [Streptomyces sp. NPDC002643]